MRPANLWAGTWVLGAFAVVACALSTGSAKASDGASSQPTLCGWLDNPTPGNSDLIDRDGRWVVGLQGGHQAAGSLPAFADRRWVRTGHGSAGYGCVCIKGRIDRTEHKILEITQARTLPLATCRKDPAIKDEEPFNPLK